MTNSDDIRNKLAIKGTRIGIWDWNIQTGEAFFNERYAEIIGLKLKDFGKQTFDTWLKYAHPDDVQKSNEELEKHFKGETEYYDMDSRMKHKDGHWVWVHTRGKVFEWDKQGKPLRMSGSHTDISEKKQVELELKNALTERDILLKEVHHRVKNNLQILLSLTRLKSKNGQIETREIENSINSISAAYEAIYKTNNLRKISVGDHVRSIAKKMVSDLDVDFNLKAEELNETIDFMIPIGLIITELVNNSIKHGLTPTSTGFKIDIDIKKVDGHLVILYADNGKGYKNEDLSDGSKVNSYGMSIIYSLIEQLEGSIRFFNKSGAFAEIKIGLSISK
jgi:PAS domain S-box-containing protein